MIDFDLIVGFDWDEGNRRKNEVKHSVSQIEAEEVFFNSPLLVNADDKHSREEMRYFALGVSNSNRKITIVFTLRANGSLIRVISARDQHRKERNLYDQAQE
jgi:uncharacterized DUF497 family protein